MKLTGNGYASTCCKLILPIFGKGFTSDRLPNTTLLKYAIMQKLLRINCHVPWPIHPSSFVKGTEKILAGDNCPGYAPFCYIDGRNGIEIGSNVWIGPGVKLISMNHDTSDYETYIKEGPIKIGNNCWLAANSIILPGVSLAEHTIVAAGSVVNKSFHEMNTIIAGVPAKTVKKLPDYRGKKVLTS